MSRASRCQARRAARRVAGDVAYREEVEDQIVVVVFEGGMSAAG